MKLAVAIVLALDLAVLGATASAPTAPPAPTCAPPPLVFLTNFGAWAELDDAGLYTMEEPQ